MNLKLAFALSLVSVYLKMRYGIMIHPFIPFLVFQIKKPLISILWSGFFCGLIVDLFSSQRFGITCFLFTLTAFSLSFFQKYFDEKKPLIFFLMTFISSIVFSLYSLFLLHLIERDFSLSFSSITTELVVYCCLDAIFGLTMFYFPLIFLEKLKKIPIKRLFSRRKKARG